MTIEEIDEKLLNCKTDRELFLYKLLLGEIQANREAMQIVWLLCDKYGGEEKTLSISEFDIEIVPPKDKGLKVWKSEETLERYIKAIRR